MKKKIVIALLLCFELLSADITGIGFASTKQEAKKEALADLAGNIKSEVRSHYESHSTQESSSSKATIYISANLPILGAKVSVRDKESYLKGVARLSPKNVNKLYTRKLKDITQEIESVLKELKKSKNSSTKLTLYQDIYALLSEYSRYKSVALILNATLPKAPTINKSQVKIAIAKLYSKIDTLSMASKLFEKSFQEKGIFVYAPKLQNYTTVSEFGAVFQKLLKSHLHTTNSLKNAKYLLVGNYLITKKNIVLNYDLLESRTNRVVSSKTVTINKKAYKNLQIRPKNIDFDALLNSGIINSSDLKVSLQSNKGSDSLLFREGEEVELFIKLNKMGYVYIVGYTQSDRESFSYLLELNEGHGDAKFKMFVNADDANRWLSLGSFIVSKPFGVESLQIIASNKKIKRLPNTKYDEESGYYIVSKKIKKTLLKTRGLKRKRSKKVEMSEDVLTFTTMPRF